MKKSIPDQNLDAEEQAIEADAPAAKKRLPAKRRKQIEKAKAEALEQRQWGGKRPGAGRPARPVTKRNISLTPEADAALLRLREKKGMTQGDAASWAIVEAEKAAK